MEGAEQRRFLYVGCGSDRKVPWVFEGWRQVRLDIDPGVAPDIVASMTDLSSIPDASFDAVYSRHNLEHLDHHQVIPTLQGFFRVLRPDGLLLMIVPDLQRMAELVAAGKLEEQAYESDAGPIAAIDVIYGHRGSIARGNGFMAHRTGFTATTLAHKLKQAGFARAIVQRAGFALAAYGLVQLSTETRLPHPSPFLASESPNPLRVSRPTDDPG